ncbi:MAG: cation transporter [Bacteroidales bacterium]
MIKKYFYFIISFAIIIAACNSQAKKDEQESNLSERETNVNPENMLYIKYDVQGMTCEGCEKAINSNIQKLEGIAEVSSSHVDSVTHVKFDKAQTSIEEIQQVIENTGYTVESYEIVIE